MHREISLIENREKKRKIKNQQSATNLVDFWIFLFADFIECASENFCERETTLAGRE